MSTTRRMPFWDLADPNEPKIVRPRHEPEVEAAKARAGPRKRSWCRAAIRALGFAVGLLIGALS